MSKRGIYVPNDLFLGENNSTEHDHITLNASDEEDVLGVLLYGINSSGKSSLMKSIGLSVVLAKAGFFVPAVELRFGVYDKLFARMVSQDNLYKGLSTFAVEMILPKIYLTEQMSVLLFLEMRYLKGQKQNPLLPLSLQLF